MSVFLPNFQGSDQAKTMAQQMCEVVKSAARFVATQRNLVENTVWEMKSPGPHQARIVLRAACNEIQNAIYGLRDRANHTPSAFTKAFDRVQTAYQNAIVPANDYYQMCFKCREEAGFSGAIDSKIFPMERASSSEIAHAITIRGASSKNNHSRLGFSSDISVPHNRRVIAQDDYSIVTAVTSMQPVRDATPVKAR